MKYLILILIIFATIASAREISVQIEKDNEKEAIVINAGKIISDSKVDIDLPFTETEKTIIKTGLNLSTEEDDVLNIVLSSGAIDVSQINDYVSALNKLQKKKPLSSSEIKYLLEGQANEKIKYLSRKKTYETY